MILRLHLQARRDSWVSGLLLRYGAWPKTGVSLDGWRGASLSDTGCRRETNEDRCLLLTPADRHVLEAKGVLAIVADGMGGHAAGEVASGMAVEIVSSVYYESEAASRAALRRAFAAANQAIFDEGRGDERLRGMGTTCTALALIGRRLVWAHVGDSRLYRLRRGRLAQLTDDDSEVRGLERHGWITRREARRHPQRNILSRALGVEAELVPALSPELATAQWKDRYLLCSDGLHDVVEERELKDILRGQDLDEACARLIELARARGGPDNITAVILERE